MVPWFKTPELFFSQIQWFVVKREIDEGLTVGLGIQRRGGGGMGSGAARYGGGEYLPEGKQPGAVIGAPWSPLLPIILSGEYIILLLPVMIGFHRFAFKPHARAHTLGLKPAAIRN
ncbi:hypothetical protein M0802_004278 [Mischocyttarus mexicanus]|nr:hypothetical protein M0802_004278 [Mischocyttarus mexicanus]